MPRQMILMAGEGIGLVRGGETGVGVCVAAGSPLGVNDLGGESSGFGSV